MAGRALNALKVVLNGRNVGKLTKAASGAIEFRYDRAWLDWEHALPVSLSLPLREEPYLGARATDVFDNLLPDNRETRIRIAERSQAEGIDAYSLLYAIGRDCAGALQFLPPNVEPQFYDPGNIRSKPISDAEIELLIRNLKTSPLGLDTESDFRISIAGVQEKTALLRRNGRWELPLGATPTTHILKPAIGKLENGLDMSLSVENEHFCLSFLRAIGMQAARTEIATFGKTRVLIVERFDRIQRDHRLIRLPQEDLCQALGMPWTRKYENEGGPGIPQIIDLLQASDDPAADRKRFLAAQIVFWLLGATDGHAKNFSIHLSPGGRFRLAPLYDVVSAQPNVDARQISMNKYKMAMAVGDKRHYVVGSIAARHYHQVAHRCGVPAADVTDIFDQLTRSVPDALGRTIADMPDSFPAQLEDSIATGVTKRLSLLK